MLNIENYLQDRYPRWQIKQSPITRPLITALRLLLHEKELRQIEAENTDKTVFDFIGQVLRYFDFSYCAKDGETQRIPATGKVVIIANHPIGTLDGLALLEMVGKVRSDVKIIANDVLSVIKPLQPLLLPVNNMRGNTARKNLIDIRKFLEDQGALLVFPAGEVSRFGRKGVCDGKWHHGFLRLAIACQTPILPVYFDARNSVFFYALSMLVKPLSTLWLVHEMFKHKGSRVDIRIGELIAYQNYQFINLPIREKAQLFKRHLYLIGKNRAGIFPCQKSIALPERRHDLRNEIQQCELLEQTVDNMAIYLYQHQQDTSIMREVGRLRELSFRAVNQGTGEPRDLDNYDQSYLHLILWDKTNLEIVGAYRLRDTRAADANTQSHSQLYCSTLFDFTPAMQPYFAKGLELGRSFVQPSYWGRRSLGSLWLGIGAFLQKNPQYRYLYGPVSLSGLYPTLAKDMLVYFYQQHFKTSQALAEAKNPYNISFQQQEMLAQKFPGVNYPAEFTHLKHQLANIDLRVPTLYKQYSELCHPGGIQFAAFNIDPIFANCIDGLIIIDLTKLKASKRKRYMG